MTNDERIRELISAYLDYELSPDERAYVERQLARDSELRDYHRELMGVRQSLKSLPHYEAPPGAHSAIMERIAAATARPLANDSAERAGARSRRLRYVGWLVVAAAAAGLAVVLMPPTRQPEAPEIVEHQPSGAPVAPELANRPGTDPRGELRPDKVNDPDRLASNQPGENGGSARIATNSGGGSDSRMASVDRTPTHPGAAPASPPTSPQSPGGLVDAATIPFTAMVVDVVLTPRGIQEKMFDMALQRIDIPWKNAIQVDTRLERALLAQRAFGALGAQDLPFAPPEPAPNEDYFNLVFVVARGRQFDGLIQELYDRRAAGDVAAVQLDFAMGSSESALFVQMEKLAEQTPEVPASVVHAHPVVMAEEIRARLRDAFVSAHAKNGANDNGALPAEVLPPELGQDDSILPPADAESIRAMEELQFNVLFILRSESKARQGTSN